MGDDERNNANSNFRYLIVWPNKGRLLDSFRLLLYKDMVAGFVESSEEMGPVPDDHRWVIVVSIIIRKIIVLFGKPMEWTGIVVEYILNLLSENGGLFGLMSNLLTGKMVLPQRNSETFISTIGHLDGRIDLYKCDVLTELMDRIRDSSDMSIEIGNRALMDLCMMASKLAYENAKVVKNIVVHHWKMHFVDFYNGWNDFQRERSTQVFILCDKPKDASLVLISFRGTEPFDADDWGTDFDYSWYEIPEVGKVHMGFLEALGLGNRTDVATFGEYLKIGLSSNHISSDIKGEEGSSKNTENRPSGATEYNSDGVAYFAVGSAYFAVRRKLKSLLEENKNAKFIVTGHSLGGSLAILFPMVLLLHKEEEMMKKLLGIYTFGQPRVGDRQLVNFMEAHINHPVPRYFRMVYCNDLVSRLPYDDKTFLYKHFGICLYYNSFYVEQDMKEEPYPNCFGMRFLVTEHLNAVWELIRGLTMGYTYGPDYKEGWFSILLRIIGLAIPGISAHCPTNYVNSIRLGRQRVQMSSI